jgi:hypothetical protein
VAFCIAFFLNDAMPYTQGVRNRASPSRLVKLYKCMLGAQRDMITKVDFGGLLSIGTSTLPSDLTKWVIRNFNAKSSEPVSQLNQFIGFLACQRRETRCCMTSM